MFVCAICIIKSSSAFKNVQFKILMKSKLIDIFTCYNDIDCGAAHASTMLVDFIHHTRMAFEFPLHTELFLFCFILQITDKLYYNAVCTFPFLLHFFSEKYCADLRSTHKNYKNTFFCYLDQSIVWLINHFNIFNFTLVTFDTYALPTVFSGISTDSKRFNRLVQQHGKVKLRLYLCVCCNDSKRRVCE